MTEITLDSLRADSQQAVAKTNDVIEQQNTKYKPDPRFWKPIIPKDGNSEYVIRFLPNAHGTTPPFIHIYEFQFQKGNKWYINTSRETIRKGEKDPCNEMTLRDIDILGIDEVRRQGRVRKTANIANILVIQDRVNPANEGKVMLYKFTRQILDKIEEVVQPKYGAKPINIFDLESGPNFIIRTKKKGGMVNYLDSIFTPELKPVTDTPEGILEIAKQTVDLYEFKNPANFKSYEELKAKLDNVMGTNNTGFGGGPVQQSQGGNYTPMNTGQPQDNLEAQAPWVAKSFNYPEPPADTAPPVKTVSTETAPSETSAKVINQEFFEDNLNKTS